MKKLCLTLILVLMPCFANGASVITPGGSNVVYLKGETGQFNLATQNAQGTAYYACSNLNGVLVHIDCYAYAMSYTSISGGKGTAAAPYILTNCELGGCACPYDMVVTDKEQETVPIYKGCASCGANSFGSVDGGWHTNTTCMCDTGHYVDFKAMKCSQCPSWGGAQGTTDGPGENEITDCFIVAGSTFDATEGQGSIEGKCYYSEDGK